MKSLIAKSLALAAFVGSALLATTAQAVTAPASYTDGDLILGFHATAGVGAGQSIVVDLGPVPTATGTVSTSDLDANLVAVFGQNWQSRTDILLGAVSVNQSTATLITTATADNVLGNGTTNAQLFAISKVHSLTQVFSTSSATGSVVQAAGSANNWASYNTGSLSFGFFNPSIEGTPSQALSLYSFAPATSLATAGAAGTNLGAFAVNSNGSVLFVTAADVAAGYFPRAAALASGKTIPASLYQDGDLIVGVHALSGQGAGEAVVADLGPVATAAGTIATGDFGANLVATFGSNWHTRGDIEYGFVSVNSNFISNPTIVASSDPANTLPGLYSHNAQLSAISKIHSAVTAFTTSGATGSLVEAAGSANAWNSSSVNANGLSFGLFNPTIEADVGSYVNLFTFAPGSAPVSAGGLSLNGGGSVKFITASTLATQQASAASTIGFASSTFTAAQLATSATINLTRSGATTTDAFVTVYSQLGASGVAEFPVGATTATATVTFAQNITASDVSGQLLLGSTDPAAVVTASATLVVPNIASTIGFASTTVNATVGAATQTVTISRTGASVLDTFVTVTATGGTPASQVVELPVGATTANVTVTLPSNNTNASIPVTLTITKLTTDSAAHNTEGSATISSTNGSETISVPGLPSYIAFSSATGTVSATSTTLTVGLVRTGNPASANDVTVGGFGGPYTAHFTAGATIASVIVNLPASTVTASTTTYTLGGSTDASASNVAPTTEVVTIAGYSTAAPTLTVTSPTNTTSLAATGTAFGNLPYTVAAAPALAAVPLASVTISVNGGTPTDVTSTPTGTLNGVLTNNAGTMNTVVVTATDVNGNSTSVTRFVKYTASAKPVVTVTGASATITVATAVAVGGQLSITAPAAAGFLFDHWTVPTAVNSMGTVTASTTVYGSPLVTAVTNALVTANAITAVYVTAPYSLSSVNTGTFAGLVTANPGFTDSNKTNGYFQTTISSTGALTAALKINGAAPVPASGKVTSPGTGTIAPIVWGTAGASFVTVSIGSTNATLVLSLDTANNVVIGQLYDGNNLSTVTAPHHTTTNTLTSYTGIVPTTAAVSGTAPTGADSVVTFNVTAAGLVSGAVLLADGHASLTFGSFAGSVGTFPLYIVEGTGGSFSGTVTFGTTISGSFKWFHPATGTGYNYDAFYDKSAIDGGVYVGTTGTTLFTGALAAAPYNNAVFTGAGLASSPQTSGVKVNPIAATAALTFAKVTLSDTIAFTTFTPASGLLVGSRVITGTGAANTIPAYTGVTIQNATVATPGIYGFFSTGAADGLFTLTHN